MSGDTIGIDALNVFCGFSQISVEALFRGRGLDLPRMANLMMDARSVQLPFEDPVTNAVNAAKPLVDALTHAERDQIELLVTSTESGLDYSKSVASYVHEHLGLSRHCRVLEVKQACYAATAMVQLAAGYLASGIVPAPARALVIATDVTVLDAANQYAEPATGHGAAAMLIGHRPGILALDLGAHGNYSFETMDTARPTPTLDLWDTDLSLTAYLDCLAGSYRHYRHRRPATNFADTFDHLAFHTPFAGLVKAAHRKMMREHAPRPPEAVQKDFDARVAPSLTYPRRVGNLCSGSVYLALSSIIDTAPQPEGQRVGLYSYGSGCASEFFSGVIQPGARARQAARRIAERLRDRRELAFHEYSTLQQVTRTCLVPEPYREVDLSDCEAFIQPTTGPPETLVLSGVENYRRHYEWR